MPNKPKFNLIQLLNTKIYWLWLFIIFVFSRLATWFYPIDSDHWIFFYVGKIMAQQGTLFTAAWDHKPPLVFFINAIMSVLFGSNIWLHRLFLTILTLVDTYLFYLILKKLVGKIFPNLELNINQTIVRVGLIFYVFWRNLSQFTSSGNNTENFSLIFLFIMILGYFQFMENPKYKSLLISGIGLSGIVFLKPNFVLFSLPIWIDLLISLYQSKAKLWHRALNLVKYSSALLIPVVAQFGIWLTYFYSNNAISDFYIASLQFNVKYLKASWEGKITSGYTFITIMAGTFLLYLILGVNYSLLFRKFITNIWARFVFLWFISGALFIFILGSFYPYYYLSVMPILVLLITLYFGLVIQNTYNETIQKYKLLTRLSGVFLVLIILLNIGISYKQFYNFFAGSVYQSSVEDKEIGDYIKSNSKSDDKIFANTYGATFYYLADRDSGSRYISASVLLLDYREHFGFNMNQTFMNEMDKSKAKYIIMPKDKNSLYLQNTELNEYFKKNYKFEKDFDTYQVWVRR